MDTATFINHYPRLYHMAQSGSWESIRRHGLLSTSAILGLLGTPPGERRQLETQRRPQNVRLNNPVQGDFTLRDNKPLRDAMLQRSLQGGLTPSDWYRILNSRVFFWPTRERVMVLLSARAYRRQQHLILEVDTAALVAQHANAIVLSPINSGATIYQPTPRGPQTFKTIAAWPAAVGPRSGRLRMPVAEVAVIHSVPRIAAMVTSAEEMRNGTRITKLV